MDVWISKEKPEEARLSFTCLFIFFSETPYSPGLFCTSIVVILKASNSLLIPCVTRNIKQFTDSDKLLEFESSTRKAPQKGEV